MLIVMSLLGGALTVLLVAERLVRRKDGTIEIPYGVAIALAGLIAIREPLFNHLS
jgi:prepilin peptidase CpaA